MIVLDLKIIGINMLFGIFALTILNASSILFDKYKKPIFSNFIYFFITLSCGLIYVVYIDKVFLNFKIYYLFFVFFGFLLASKIPFFNIEKEFILFSFLMTKLVSLIVWLLHISFNYSLCLIIYQKIKFFLKKNIKNI